MVFYLIGLGLGDVEDISVKGLNIIRRCSKVYLENYTSLLSYGQNLNQLEEFYGRKILEADREFVEQNIDQIITNSIENDIALLVIGDPFGATTHIDLVIRAKEKSIPVKTIHNASILTAVGCCGLQLYNFGATVSIPQWTDNWKPDSFLDKIALNRNNGLHTLCLLDIKTKEQSIENMMRGKKEYLQPQFLTCSEAANQILAAIEKRKNDDKIGGLNEQILVVGLARIGWDNQKILFCSLAEMVNTDFGPPIHCLIITAEKLHPIEEEMLQTFTLNIEEHK